MSGRRAWILALPLLALAVLIGVAWTRSRREEPRPEPSKGKPGQAPAPPSDDPRSNGPASAVSASPGRSLYSAELRIRVTDEKDAPVPGARVRISLEGPLEREGLKPWVKTSGALREASGVFAGNPVTNAEGVAALTVRLDASKSGSARSVEISARAEGFVDGWNSTYGLPLPADGEKRDVVLRLVRGARVKGQVLNVDPEDAEKLFVELRPRDVPNPDDLDSHWFQILAPQRDGSFLSKEAPLTPLLVIVKDLKGKYKEGRSEINPPFPETAFVPLERDASAALASALRVNLAGVPENARHEVFVYSSERNALVGGAHDVVGTKAVDIQIFATGACEVMALPTGESTTWAGGHAALAPGGRSSVTLTPRPSGSVLLRVVDAATGGPPEVASLDIWLLARFGNHTQKVRLFGGLDRQALRRGLPFPLKGIPDVPTSIQIENPFDGVYQDLRLDLPAAAASAPRVDAPLLRR